MFSMFLQPICRDEESLKYSLRSSTVDMRPKMIEKLIDQMEIPCNQKVSNITLILDGGSPKVQRFLNGCSSAVLMSGMGV